MRISDWSSDVCSSDLRTTEQEAVAGLFARRVDAADDARAELFDGRLDGEAAGTVERLLFAAERALEIHLAFGALETGGVGIDHQLAGAAVGEFEAALGHRRMHQIGRAHV